MAGLTKRQKNIIKRMCDGAVFWVKTSPKMTEREMYDLEKHGYIIQSDHVRGEGQAFYPLRTHQFLAQARKDGIIDNKIPVMLVNKLKQMGITDIKSWLIDNGFDWDEFVSRYTMDKIEGTLAESGIAPDC